MTGLIPPMLDGPVCRLVSGPLSTQTCPSGFSQAAPRPDLPLGGLGVCEEVVHDHRDPASSCRTQPAASGYLAWSCRRRSAATWRCHPCARQAPTFPCAYGVRARSRTFRCGNGCGRCRSRCSLLLAAQPELVTPLPPVVRRAVSRHLLDDVVLRADPCHGGAVTLVQRLGSTANPDVHLRCLLVDWVYRCGHCRRRTSGTARRGFGCVVLGTLRVTVSDDLRLSSQTTESPGPTDGSVIGLRRPCGSRLVRSARAG
jgi:hypothetical protein